MSAARKLQEVAAPPPASQSGAEWNRRILVVDDEPEIGQIVLDILCPPVKETAVRSSRQSRAAAPVAVAPVGGGAHFQFDVTVARSAREALVAVEKLKNDGQTFAMGFFDVRLGEGMDGVQLVHEIHKSFPGMYAVFVTAYNDRTIDSITTEIPRATHWDYMNKPFNSAEITQKARNFVSLWNYEREAERHNSNIAELNRRVLESERVTSVAAVARGVAHEFGNLLMQIMGKAEVSRGRSPEQMNAALEKIVDASQRAHEILNKFNHLSDTKSQASKKEPMLVEDIVNEAIDLMSHQFKKANIKICMIKKDRVTAHLHATSILQVLVNLFINAMHVMPHSGQIDIAIVDSGEDFEIRVRDYGTGIPADLLPRVTEAFFTTKGDKGTGLGLAISREIVEIDHGGEFKLQNHATKGLEVTMRFPKTMTPKEVSDEKV